MTSGHKPGTGGTLPANRVALAVIGLAVVVAGLLLPQMLPDASRPAGQTAPAKEPGILQHPPPAAIPGGASEGSLDYQPPAWPEPPDPRTLLIRLAIGTVVVLVLCVVVLRFCKGWLTGTARPRPTDSAFQVVDTLALGNRCCLHLVKIGKRQVLVGVDATGLKAVTTLPDSFDSALAGAELEPAEGGEKDNADLGLPGPEREDENAPISLEALVR